MLINQHQRDEFDLAMSCIDHEVIPPILKPKKTEYTKSGFSREETVALAIEYYRDYGHANQDEFFKIHRTNRTHFHQAIKWFELDIRRYYRIDGGKVYHMNWIAPQEVMKRKEGITTKAITRPRSVAFLKHHADTRELFVELANMQYCYYYKKPKEFFELLRTIDISRGTYYQRLKKYRISVEVFMSVDNGELFRLKFNTPKY
ncbi:hypothetical protein GV858_05990 [Salmonella enterica]|nr:hypothetical protein [Salmonella enterica]